MKTTKQWLETLPEPYRTQAFENAKLYGLLNRSYSSLKESLYSAFLWGETELGYTYWFEVMQAIRKGTIKPVDNE